MKQLTKTKIHVIRDLENKYNLKLLEDDNKTFTVDMYKYLTLALLKTSMDCFETIVNIMGKEETKNV